MPTTQMKTRAIEEGEGEKTRVPVPLSSTPIVSPSTPGPSTPLVTLPEMDTCSRDSSGGTTPTQGLMAQSLASVSASTPTTAPPFVTALPCVPRTRSASAAFHSLSQAKVKAATNGRNPSGLNAIYAGTPCLLRHHNPSFIPCRLFFSYIRRDGRFEKFFETSAHTDANLDSNSTATSNTLRIHRERHYSITPNYWIFTISRSLYVVCGLGCGCDPEMFGCGGSVEVILDVCVSFTGYPVKSSTPLSEARRSNLVEDADPEDEDRQTNPLAPFEDLGVIGTPDVNYAIDNGTVLYPHGKYTMVHPSYRSDASGNGYTVNEGF
ncbi:hypothetical protein BT96DRAFT_999890 [Gymnopus androsaceus JB14]|uniref:Uncharacterized protein n=1 Tax=Gymnopus androsaceus JB14 TaxID=1447944 RepID=A0A6A4H5E0_9AGAR|nr:hypothetical protein BT96DRAFT_999890 [Gymnopus androsaceus JB14]